MKLLLLASLALAAQQTAITPPQLSVTAPAAGQVRLLALEGNSFRAVELGVGLTLTTTGTGGYRIDVAIPPAPRPTLYARPMTRESDGRYGTYLAGLVTRNGVVQLPGVDYTVVGGFITPEFGGWDVADKVVLWTIL